MIFVVFWFYEFERENQGRTITRIYENTNGKNHGEKQGIFRTRDADLRKAVFQVI